ncbi:MAG TPA: hypothetical protein VL966_13280 [Alphaproteobacteria bacterium]|nr:hypothetical protein [Alphaproteobacteria bacterium]
MDSTTDQELARLSADMMVMQTLFVSITKAMLRSRSVEPGAIVDGFEEAAALLASLRSRLGESAHDHVAHAAVLLEQLRSAISVSAG